MRDHRNHRGPSFALVLAAALMVALPLPASAGPASPAPGVLPSAPVVGDGAADAALAEIAPSGDEAFSPDILTASTSLTARDLAKETGERVEVLDERTTTSSLYALPDGTWQLAQSGGPQWAQTAGDGTAASDWQNVDSRLVENGDGSYSPNVHPQNVVVNGGSGEFFRMADPETGLAVSLALGDGALPPPLVDGPRATFAEIARDTDLVVEIRPAGYEYYLVVKTPAAASASSGVPLVFTMTGATMSPDGSGGFLVLDGAGVVIGAMPPPVAWDASSDLKRGSPVLDDWSPTQKFAPVTRALEKAAPPDRVSKIRDFLASGDDLQTETIVEVSQILAPTDVQGTFDVELAVPAQWVDDPATQYPLVLDPSGATGASFDTFVQGGYTSDQSGAIELKLGTYDSGAHIARSFLSFAWTDYQYTTVTAASMNLWEWHSWSCSATGWDAYLASPASTGTRWTSQPWYGYPYGLSYSTTGFSSSCNDGWVSMDITNLAQIWNGYTAGTARSVALAGDSELNNYNWKRFNSNEAGWGVPYLWLTYTSTPPKAPTDVKVGGETLTAAHRTDFTSKRPVFSAKVEDIAEPPAAWGTRNLHAVFVLYKDGVEVGAYDGTTVAPGGVSTYTPTFDLEEGANYTLYVATVFNATTVSTGIMGGGTFTTTSTLANQPCGLRVNGAGVDVAAIDANGTVAAVDPALVLCGVKEVIEPGDVNGDGKRDLLVWDTDGTLRALLGNGTGGVQSAAGIPIAGNWGAYTRILGPGDFSGDGKVDLISMDAAGYLYLHRGDGAGAFAASSYAIGSGWQGFRDILTPGDINMDGKNDVVAWTSDYRLELYRGNGAGAWISPYPTIGTGWSFTDILTPGNFNTDSYNAPDLVGWMKSTGALWLYYGIGTGGAVTGGALISSGFGSFARMYAPGDFNGNGTSDLLGYNANGTLTLFDGNGVGGISASGTPVEVSPVPTAPVANLALTDSTPALSAVVSDPDGGQVRAVFSLYRRRAGDAEWELVRNDMYGSWVTSGQRSYFRSSASSNDPGLEAALLAGNEYRIEVRSQDKSRSSALALTTGTLAVAPPGAAPEIPAGCDTLSGTPSGSSPTC